MATAHRYLVVGTGSIGRRHIANLRSMFPEAIVDCVTASGRSADATDVGADTMFASLSDAAAAGPRFAIVASPSTLHAEQSAFLLTRGIPVLIEKPLADSMASLQPFLGVLQAHQTKIGVGYNLRLLGSAACMKSLINERRIGRVLSVSAEVGQYLPDWRKGVDYRNNVSARRALGGGALLELSHELDYLHWLFGPAERVYCLARNTGSLDIDVEDMAVAILTGPDQLPITVHLDFLQRKAFRHCKVVGETGTLIWDIMTNSVVLHASADSEVLFSDATADRNRMYLDEIAHFSRVVDGVAEPQVNLMEAVAVLKQIDALRLSASTGASVEIRIEEQ